MPVTISMSVSSYDGRGRVRKLNQLFFAEFSAKGVPPTPLFFRIFLLGSTCCETDSAWYGKFILVCFDTFTKVRKRGQHAKGG